MLKFAMSKYLFLSAALFLLFPVSAGADCYVDCMNASGCWSARSDENVSYCSGTKVQCETQCRNQSKSFGAIAYSVKDEGYGYSDSQKDRKAAEKTAMNYCKKYGKKCKVEVWFYNSCGAVAADGKKTGWGQSSNENSARKDALDKCRKSGGKHCAVKASHCSW